MPKETTPLGATPLDAEVGQFFFAAAHEMGHATFDQLDLPLFGRQEDDADQFATYIMLQSGKEDARRLIARAAHSYEKYLLHPEVTAPLKDFPDSHGSPEHRYFKLICLACGADPVLSADVVENDHLLDPVIERPHCQGYPLNALSFADGWATPHLDHELEQQVLHREWLPPERATVTTPK